LRRLPSSSQLHPHPPPPSLSSPRPSRPCGSASCCASWPGAVPSGSSRPLAWPRVASSSPAEGSPVYFAPHKLCMCVSRWTTPGSCARRTASMAPSSPGKKRSSSAGSPTKSHVRQGRQRQSTRAAGQACPCPRAQAACPCSAAPAAATPAHTPCFSYISTRISESWYIVRRICRAPGTGALRLPEHQRLNEVCSCQRSMASPLSSLCSLYPWRMTSSWRAESPRARLRRAGLCACAPCATAQP